jgi:hypothetical protein
MSKKLAPKAPAHLAIEWGGEEPDGILWCIRDTTVDADDYWMREVYTNGMLIMGIETKEEAERIVREKLNNHVPAAIQWYGQTEKRTPEYLRVRRERELGGTIH